MIRIKADAYAKWLERLPLSEGWETFPIWEISKFQEVLTSCNFEEDVFHALSEARAEIQSKPFLQRLCMHADWEIFEAAPSHPLPPMPEDFGMGGRLLYAMAVLGRVPLLEKQRQARKIPMEIIQETLSDLPRWMRAYHSLYGRWGFDKPYWMRNHLTGKLVSLGRLQFEITSSNLPFYFFRSVKDGRITALASAGMFCDKDGFPKSAPALWTTRYTETESHYEGFAIPPRAGHIDRHWIRLEKSEWKMLAAPDSPTLNVHIPADTPLDFETCEASFRRAEVFFPKHYPEHPFHGFRCTTWMLEPQLYDYLPATSNLARFFNAFFALPVVDANDKQLFERVFWGAEGARENLPRKTTLQRIVLEHVERGGTWRTGAGFRARASVE